MTFISPQGKKETFKDLANEGIALPLRLYSQHYAIDKPQKHTHPNKWVAGFMAKAMAIYAKLKGDFSHNILSELIGYKKSNGMM